MDVDETDRRIISLLEEDGRRPVTDIADQVGLSPAAIHNRLVRLEDVGVIKGYDAIVDSEALGFEAHAVIHLRFEQGRVSEVKAQLQELPGVQSIRMLADRWDGMVRVYAPDHETLRELLFDEIKEMPGIARSEMSLILDTDYRSHGLPVENYPQDGDDSDDAPSV